MYKRASESAQQRLHGRGKLSGAGKLTVPMTGPVPINKRALKKAAHLKKTREIAAAKKSEEQRRKKEVERLELERARQESHERQVQELQQMVRENLLTKKVGAPGEGETAFTRPDLLKVKLEKAEQAARNASKAARLMKAEERKKIKNEQRLKPERERSKEGGLDHWVCSIPKPPPAKNSSP
jgi:hypothetical protein